MELFILIFFFFVLLFLSAIVSKLEHIRKNTKVQMDQNDRMVDLLKELAAANRERQANKDISN